LLVLADKRKQSDTWFEFFFPPDGSLCMRAGGISSVD
jgi:hypothetical protein